MLIKPVTGTTPIEPTTSYERKCDMKTSNPSERGTLPRDLNFAELEAVSGGFSCVADLPRSTNREWLENNGIKWPIPDKQGSGSVEK
jgi:hypothetical protein